MNRVNARRAAAGSGRAITTAPGFFTRREFTDRYAELTGFDLGDLDFYVAFACFRLAVILEGIHARFLQDVARIASWTPVLAGRGAPLSSSRTLTPSRRGRTTPTRFCGQGRG
ncbi:hypothetical protein [Actinomadura macra]|uniref:hypothetical protein n=1 Tax=Actinomadura macra TaxID=46164 RepID=UPI003F7709DA